jgi:hypothetical protein
MAPQIGCSDQAPPGDHDQVTLCDRRLPVPRARTPAVLRSAHAEAVGLMPWPVPDRRAAVSAAAEVEVAEVVSLSLWAVTRRPAAVTRPGQMPFLSNPVSHTVAPGL